MDGNISYKLEPYRNYHNPITCLASLQPSSPPIVVSVRERKTFLSRECAFSSRIPRCTALRNLSFLYTWNEYNCIGISKRSTYVHLLHDPRMLNVLLCSKSQSNDFFFPCTWQGNAVLSMNRLNFAKYRDKFINIHININISFTFLGKYLL